MPWQPNSGAARQGGGLGPARCTRIRRRPGPSRRHAWPNAEPWGCSARIKPHQRRPGLTGARSVRPTAPPHACDARGRRRLAPQGAPASDRGPARESRVTRPAAAHEGAAAGSQCADASVCCGGGCGRASGCVSRRVRKRRLGLRDEEGKGVEVI